MSVFFREANQKRGTWGLKTTNLNPNQFLPVSFDTEEQVKAFLGRNDYGNVMVVYCPTQEELADALTKASCERTLSYQQILAGEKISKSETQKEYDRLYPRMLASVQAADRYQDNAEDYYAKLVTRWADVRLSVVLAEYDPLAAYFQTGGAE